MSDVERSREVLLTLIPISHALFDLRRLNKETTQRIEDAHGAICALTGGDGIDAFALGERLGRYERALQLIAGLPSQTNMREASDAANTAIEIAREALRQTPPPSLPEVP